jgi:hypothetical protein
MNKKIFISSLLIIFSFFLWYFYKFYEVSQKIKKLENKKYYIDIKQTKKSIKIKNPNSNVIIFLWEKKLQNIEEKILLTK